MKHSKLITVAIMIGGYLLYKIIGKDLFTVVFATTFIILFLLPIVVAILSLKTSKKLNLMLKDYYETKDLEHIATITKFLAKKRYQGPEDYKFYSKMRELFASVEEHPQATDAILSDLKHALSRYKITIDGDLEEELLESV